MKRFTIIKLTLVLGFLLALLAGGSVTMAQQPPEPPPDTFQPGVVLVKIDRPITDVLPWPGVVDRPDRLDAFGWRLATVPVGREDEIIAALAGMGIQAERSTYGKLYESPNDPYYTDGTQWGPGAIQAPGAWDYQRGNAATIVCVIDSGIADDHPDLAAKVVAKHSVLGDDGYEGFSGHGTFVAGVAAASTNNGVGIAGIGWNPKIRSVKVTRGLIYKVEDLITAINVCMTEGSNVINMSLGSRNPNQALDDALTAAENAGIITVAAAGNDNEATPRYPCAYSDLCAAATHPGDGFTTWTNYGDYVNMAAPGGDDQNPEEYGPNDIWSTWYDYYTKEKTYRYWRGTSFSSPHLAGAAAVLLNNPGADRTAVVNAILDTHKDISGHGKWVTHGLIDMAAAQQVLGPTKQWRLRLNLMTLDGMFVCGVHPDDKEFLGVFKYKEYTPGQGYGPWKEAIAEYSQYFWCNMSGTWVKFYKQPNLVVQTGTDVSTLLWDITTYHKRGMKTGCDKVMFVEKHDYFTQSDDIETVDWLVGDPNQSW